MSLLTLLTLWPFPDARVRDAAHGCRRVIVPEHNFGQIAREAERVVRAAEVVPLPRIDGGLLTPEQIGEAIA